MYKTRILAIDYGLKRIGLALSDLTKIIAQPLKTFEVVDQKNRDTLIIEHIQEIQIQEIQKNESIERIVIGLPLHLDGCESELSTLVRKFHEKLQNTLKLPCDLFDERLSTVQVERLLKEARVSRKDRSKKVDAMAAVLILQTYLDRGIK